jgi:hypothetical protein
VHAAWKQVLLRISALYLPIVSGNKGSGRG